ncbi:hypothetical protein H696_06156 [Fonticula alba]|uniref:Uncharacterized protein n=1 Tax=Fonticula alba TaxID=691883 RepID=A0A058Z0G1_FONAL|nr:hypothetical protein H696_06156 [Fonticula alba]KCV67413.1 hypothetical protein H696_06156 [Fonticula alba]|eukprot:XP_009498179.1 hypothetical protein H696_06156 [Fonticula alba]
MAKSCDWPSLCRFLGHGNGKRIAASQPGCTRDSGGMSVTPCRGVPGGRLRHRRQRHCSRPGDIRAPVAGHKRLPRASPQADVAKLPTSIPAPQHLVHQSPAGRPISYAPSKARGIESGRSLSRPAARILDPCPGDLPGSVVNLVKFL